MDFFNNVAHGLEKLKAAVDLLKPAVKAIGGDKVDAIAELVSSGITIATHAVERIEQGTVVAASRDEAVIRNVLAELQAENDELKQYIADS